MQKADLSSARLPLEENELSRRYLDIITRWVHVGMATYQDWPVRPNCGHFFGGVHWYGNETSNTIFTLAAAVSSPEFCETRAGHSASDLRQACLRGLRYLLFTHDTGPADCVRPQKGWGRPENAGKKWGERGRGFFPESQCGRTVAIIVGTSMLIRDLLGEEELDMLGAVASDYIGRFGEMAPKTGVYENTQTEENAWTALGLIASLLVLPGIENEDKLWHQAKLWLFRTSTVPQDMQNSCEYDGTKVSSWCGRTFTTLPDFTAENHGVVHPSYIASAVNLTAFAMDLLTIFGKPIPPQAHWHRLEIYDLLKRWCDSTGRAHSPQGMDWPYLQYGSTCTLHAAANCYYRDPDAALMERRALAIAERSMAANDGGMVRKEVKEHGHSVQDPMIMGEIHVDAFALAYLRHRIGGLGVEPASEKSPNERLNGVYHYPSGGIVLHNHPHGITSFSWRNRTTIIPSPSDGAKMIGPSGSSILGVYKIKGTGDSCANRSIVVRELPDRASALLVQHLACDTVHRKVLFCSLPDGRGLSYEVAHALADITVESRTLGYLQIINDSFFGDETSGSKRKIHWSGGEEEFGGFISDSPDLDITRELIGSDWVNVDDRMGFRFVGTGSPVYVNRHYFEVFHAVYDEMVLGRHPENRQFKTGDKIADLAVLWCPEQDHEATKRQQFSIIKTPPNIFAADLDDWLCACNFGSEPFDLDGVSLEPMEPRLARVK